MELWVRFGTAAWWHLNSALCNYLQYSTRPDMPPPFSPEPLKNPKREVRLLQVPSDPENGDLYLTLHTADLSKVGGFYAISYQWGSDEDTGRTLYINNEQYSVRENCYQALRQAQARVPTHYVWIDALCINQKDANEKSIQVQMMGKIYARAHEVFACVGAHADGSEYLHKYQEVARIMSRSDFEIKNSQRNSAYEDSVLSQFRTACLAFSNRQYWTRRWILQELANAKAKYVLCGTSEFDWKLVELCADLTSGMPQQGLGSHGTPSALCLAARYTQLQGSELLDALRIFTRFECSDRRDRLYSLLPLIQWPSPTPIANYQQPLSGLAMEMIKYIHPQAICSLLEGLDLTCEDVDLQALAGPATVKMYESSPGSALMKLTRVPLFQLHSFADGSTPTHDRYRLELPPASSPGAATPQQKGSAAWLLWGDERLQYTCPDAKPGDFITPLIHDPSSAEAANFRAYSCLILRPISSNDLEVVGPAISIKTPFHDLAQSPIKSCNYHATVSISKIQLLLLAAATRPCVIDQEPCKVHEKEAALLSKSFVHLGDIYTVDENDRTVMRIDDFCHHLTTRHWTSK